MIYSIGLHFRGYFQTAKFGSTPTLAQAVLNCLAYLCWLLEKTPGIHRVTLSICLKGVGIRGEKEKGKEKDLPSGLPGLVHSPLAVKLVAAPIPRE